MMNWNELVSRRPILADGAWGTELQARSLAIGEFPDAWNLLHPERVEAVARAYVAAGSQIVLTNTFRANRIALAGTDLAGRIVELNRRGVELSRFAPGHYVFASMGPSGKRLASGEVTAGDLLAAFTGQAQALAAGGADAILVETMTGLDEAVIAVAAARTTGLPVVVSMVFDPGTGTGRPVPGPSPEEAAARLAGAGVSALGANCGGIVEYIEVCRRLHAATDLPIWIKANAGPPELADGRFTYRTSPEEFARSVPALVAAGATFIGGCCGTTPAFIRAVKEKLSQCA
jgi:5-methyltetrahydrofolate--homocysteine methyltransferase